MGLQSLSWAIWLSIELQEDLRERLAVGLTKIREDMNWVSPFERGPVALCPQDQPLSWLELDWRQQLHWLSVTECRPLRPWRWQHSTCPPQFSYPGGTAKEVRISFIRAFDAGSRLQGNAELLAYSIAKFMPRLCDAFRCAFAERSAASGGVFQRTAPGRPGLRRSRD